MLGETWGWRKLCLTTIGPGAPANEHEAGKEPNDHISEKWLPRGLPFSEALGGQNSD